MQRAKVTDFGLSKILNRDEVGARSILQSHNSENKPQKKIIEKFTKSASSAFHSILQISKTFSDLSDEDNEEENLLLPETKTVDQISVVMTSMTGTAAYVTNITLDIQITHI